MPTRLGGRSQRADLAGRRPAPKAPLASKETAREFIRVLGYPQFGLNAREREDLLSDYLPLCATVNVSNPPPPTPVCRDPCDLPFSQLAVAGGADFLVARDQDLDLPATRASERSSLIKIESHLGTGGRGRHLACANETHRPWR